MLAEYRSVLLRPKFGLTRPTVTALLEAFGSTSQVSQVPTPPLPDPEDEAFLAAALATPDQLLVTGNKVHFPAKTCFPVRILSPAEAVLILDTL
jgi:predicted nucleic acid-binding protein